MKRGKLSVSMNDINENEFLSTDKEGGVSQSYSRDLRIQKLRERNYKLQEDVVRVERALSGMEEKTSYGVRLPQIRGEVLKKQLENAYKQIKQYEYEVGKRRKQDFEGAFLDHLRKMEAILAQKQNASERLRRELLEVKRQSIDCTKLLKDDALKKQHAEKQGKLGTDIRWTREQLKKTEQRKLSLEGGLVRQQESIQKMEKELLKLNYSPAVIDGLRAKFFSQIENNTEQERDDKDEISDGAWLDDHSKDSYQQLVNEVKLYRKLQHDYQLKISVLTREQQEAEQRNLKSRNRLLQIEYQIEQAETTAQQLKAQVDPKALIPTKMEMIVQQKKSRMPAPPQPKAATPMPHLFPHAQYGEPTKAGKRFIDRNMIGKSSSFIIQIAFIEQTEGGKLVGVRATYLAGGKKKKGIAQVLAQAGATEEKNFQLAEGDYVKSIDCLLDEQDVIVGLAMVSQQNDVLRGGISTEKRQPLKIPAEKHPACLFGCLLDRGLSMFGAELCPDQ